MTWQAKRAASRLSRAKLASRESKRDDDEEEAAQEDAGQDEQVKALKNLVADLRTQLTKAKEAEQHFGRLAAIKSKEWRRLGSNALIRIECPN